MSLTVILLEMLILRFLSFAAVSAACLTRLDWRCPTADDGAGRFLVPYLAPALLEEEAGSFSSSSSSSAAVDAPGGSCCVGLCAWKASVSSKISTRM